MANVDFFTAFGYKWAQDGSVENTQDNQYKQGWAYIGAVPPTVEEFNKVSQVSDEKSNYLYAQMAAVFAAAGEAPSAGDLTSLLDSLMALTNKGRLLNLRAFTSSGTFTRTVGATSGIVRMVGGGGGGAGASTTTAGQISLGGGGAGGAVGMHFFNGNLPASQAYTVGAGGSAGAAGGAGGAGGTTVFGTLNAAGGNGAASPVVGAPPLLVGPSTIVTTSSGFNLFNGTSTVGGYGIGIGAGGFISGSGGGTPFGGGAYPNVTGGAAGKNASSYGTGGAGASIGASSAGLIGGAGAGGLIIIEEYA